MKNSNYSLVIPVLKMEGNPYLNDLLSHLGRQSCPPRKVHLVVGDRRQGRAINFGVSQVDTPYVGTLDDDSFIDDPELFCKLLTAMEEDLSIGMSGAACEIPEWASSFQKRAMKEIPRRYFPTQSQSVDSDMVQHPCLLMRTEFFKSIGGEDEDLIRGLDPVLRKKVRDAGKRVVVVRDTWVYHLLPPTWRALLKMYFRNGKGSGYAQRYFSERVLELTDGCDEGSFVEKRPLFFRISRRLEGCLRALFCGQWIQFSTDLAYAFGVVKERLVPSSLQVAPRVVSRDKESRKGEVFDIEVHWVTLDGFGKPN